MADDLRDKLRELMAAPLDEFTATRTRFTRAGARELAKVRKPVQKLWAANKAVTERPDAADRLATVTRRLQELQAAIAGGERRAGSDLRGAGADQKRELDVLESEAAKHAPAAAAAAREIIRRAVLAGGQTWADLLDGVLLEEPVPPGESVFGLAADALPKAAPARVAQQAERKRDAEEARRLRAEADRLEDEAAELEQQARRARSRAESAAAKAAEAESNLH